MASVKPPGFPVLAVIAAVIVAGGIIAYFSLRGARSAAPVAAPESAGSSSVTANPTAARPANEVVAAPPPAAGSASIPAQNSGAVAAGLDVELKRQRLWATVTARGPLLEVRSALCGDGGIAATVTRTRDELKAAGFTSWRCVEDSGRLVFERRL
jgi:hypothetical protein